MSEVITYLEGLQRRASEQAEDILNRGKLQGRAMTDEEKAEARDLQEKYKNLDKEITSRKEESELQASMARDMGLNGATIAAVEGKGTPERAKTLGEAFVASGVFKAIVDRAKAGRLGEGWRSDAYYVPWLDSKAATVPVLESDNAAVFGSGGAAGLQTQIPGIATPGFLFEGTKRPMIADLIPSIPVTVGNTAMVLVLADRDQLGLSDMPIAEGATKEPIGYEFDVEPVQLRKHAAYTKVSEEILVDAPSVAAYINRDLPFQIRQVEDAYLASALYTAAGNATPLTGASNTFDKILGAIAAVANAGGNPDGVLVHPTDYYTALIQKSVAGDGGYFAGGPFQRLTDGWQVRWVITQAATAGRPLVGDFNRGATLYRKGGISVDATNSDGTDFIKNLVTIRAEERLVIGVTYPELFREAVL